MTRSRQHELTPTERIILFGFAGGAASAPAEPPTGSYPTWGDSWLSWGDSALTWEPGGDGSFPTTLPGYVGSPYSIAAMRATGNLWQDAAKTVPAVFASHPVRVAVCGALEWAAPSDAARPTLVNPTGAKWGLNFDGVDDQLTAAYTGTITTPWAVFMSFKPTAATAWGLFFGSNSGGRWARSNGDTTQIQSRTQLGFVSTPTGLTLNQNYTFGDRLSGGTHSLYVNGSFINSTGDGNALVANTLTYGSGAGQGPRASILYGLIYCEGELSAQNLTDIQTFLSSLY